VVLNALIDIYAKCGTNPYNKKESYCIIIGMNHFTCIISLLGHVGYPEETLNFISNIPIKIELGMWMFLHGSCKLNVVVLNALIYMYEKYRTNPYNIRYSYCINLGMDHYTCIVDLLGSVGYPKGGLNFTTKIPIKPKLSVWMCLLSSCKSNVMDFNFVIDINT